MLECNTVHKLLSKTSQENVRRAFVNTTDHKCEMFKVQIEGSHSHLKKTSCHLKSIHLLIDAYLRIKNYIMLNYCTLKHLAPRKPFTLLMSRELCDLKRPTMKHQGAPLKGSAMNRSVQRYLMSGTFIFT